MANIFESKIGNTLYHAYLIEGEVIQTEIILKEFLVSRGVDIQDSACLQIENYESLNIEKAKLLKSYQSERSSCGNDKYFIITATGINHEAENALLKVFEEPTEGVHFFFILPKVDILPDTLRSRAHTIHTNIYTTDIFVKNFIKQNINERFKSITEVVALYKNSDTSGPLREYAINILDHLEKIIYEKNGKVIQDDVFKYEEILKARKNLSLPGSAVKMILEHIALIV